MGPERAGAGLLTPSAHGITGTAGALQEGPCTQPVQLRKVGFFGGPSSGEVLVPFWFWDYE